MMLKKDFLEDIKKSLNVNIYEAKIWTALLSRGIANASQLADISGVPRSRCYDVLETLEKKGFIITKLGKPIRYIAVEPEEVLRRRKKVVDEEVKRKVRFVDSIKGTDVFKDIGLLHKTGIEKFGIEDLSNAVVGRNEINRCIKDMVSKAKRNITVITTKDDFQRKMRLLEKVDNGVKIEIGAPIGALKVKNNGIKIKNIDVNARFVSVDGQESLFLVSDGDDSGILVKSEFFTKAIDGLFRAHMR